jgi:hypothetical protein
MLLPLLVSTLLKKGPPPMCNLLVPFLPLLDILLLLLLLTRVKEGPPPPCNLLIPAVTLPGIMCHLCSRGDLVTGACCC